MSNTNTGGPAFPVTSDNYANPESTGMTLRDYFAAKAMSSIIDQQDVHDGRVYKNVAWIAYQIADAMLKERG